MELDPSQLKLSQRVVENLTVKKNSDGTEDREYVLDMYLSTGSISPPFLYRSVL